MRFAYLGRCFVAFLSAWQVVFGIKTQCERDNCGYTARRCNVESHRNAAQHVYFLDSAKIIHLKLDRNNHIFIYINAYMHVYIYIFQYMYDTE